MQGIVITAVVIVALGALVVWWASACWRGRFGRQWVLGYRTPLTLRDRGAWDAAHRAAAPLILIAGGGAIVAAIIGVVMGITGAGILAAIVLGGALPWLIVWVMIGFIPATVAAHSFRRSASRS